MKTSLKLASLPAPAAILLAALAVLGFAGSAHAASATWTNTSGGDWQTDSNWNPAAKPSVATDTASFTNGTYTVTSTANMTGKPNVLTGQTIEFSFGSFTLSADSASGGAAIIHGGSLTLSSGIFSGGSGAGAYQSVGFDSSNSSLLITGTDSTWNLQIAGSRLGRANTVGGSANNNTVTVAAGAEFNDTSTGAFVIGQGTAINATSDNNSFTVTGAGSTANLAGSPTIGAMSAEAALVANNKLVVDNGGNMTVTRNLSIGSRSGGVTSTAFSNNLVVVGGTGTGSVLTVNGTTGVSIAASGVGTGSGVQVKSGGTINVTGGNTTLFAGAANTHLSVDSGLYNASGRTIALNGSGTTLALTNNGTVKATSITGATGSLLTGSGKVEAAVTLSGMLMPVASPSAMVLDGSATASALLTMSSGAKFGYELGSGLTSGKLNFWNYAGASDFVRNSNVIDITFLPGATTGTYNLFNFYSNNGTSLTAAGFSSGLSLNFLNGGAGTLNYDTLGQINFVVTAIPEPSTWLVSALLVAGLTTATLRRHRRRRA